MGSDETKYLAPDETVFLHYESAFPTTTTSPNWLTGRLPWASSMRRPTADRWTVPATETCSRGRPHPGTARRGSQRRRDVGFYTLYRQAGRTGFSPAEAGFMHRIEHTLAAGVRRA